MSDYPALVSPAALLLRDPEFLDGLTEAERLVLPYYFSLWRRPEQVIPPHGWRSCGIMAGRGWGKTWALAAEVTDRVEAGDLRRGEPASIALMAPNDERVAQVQIAALIEVAPPWNRPEQHRDRLEWPNGVMAELFTPEAPGRPRGGNYQLSWLCEIVDWKPSTRREAFDNITTATRIPGAAHPPQFLWDTTAKGSNDVINYLVGEHEHDPARHLLVRGSMFDNPLLPADYLADEARKYSGRRYEEEIEGRNFGDTEGANWEQRWIDEARLWQPASAYELVVLGVDPAISRRPGSDETGIVEAGLRGGEIDILADMTGRHSPEQWGDIICDRCMKGAAGCVIERNRGGDMGTSMLRARAKEKQLLVRELPDDDKPFPRRTPGVIYVREVFAHQSKQSRGMGPSVLYSAGHVHHIGVFAELESELTTYVPGTGLSPNRYDALVYAVLELSGITRQQRGSAPTTARDAAEVHRQLRAAMRAASRTRVIG